VTTTAATLPIADWKRTPVPLIIAGLAFLVAFGEPLVTLGRDWWSNPEAGHGLLLFPVAIWLAWKKKLVDDPDPSPRLGMAIIVASVLLRFLSGLAAEMFTMRLSLLGAVAGLIVYTLGMRQIMRWWLPFLLILLSIPLPEVILGSLALPLQFRASKWGAALLSMRHVPVRLEGNVLYLPGRSLFVTEACSGLRSLTALLSLGILIGGMWLRFTVSRVALVVAAIPVAMVLNAVRIFLTGFFVFFVDPKLAEGVMHLMEGWVMFVLAFLILAVMAYLLTQAETIVVRRRTA
jgi:exosortase